MQHGAQAEIITAQQVTVRINLYAPVGYLYLQYVLYHLGQTVFRTALSKKKKTAASLVRLYLKAPTNTGFKKQCLDVLFSPAA